MYMNVFSTIIHLKFENPLLNNIKELYLKPNKNIHYTNQSYLNYYTEVYNSNIILRFNGFYKDQYFIVLIDLIDKKQNNITHNNHILIMKVDWSFIKLNNEIHLYQINIIKNKKYKYFYLPLRKFLENNNDLSIEDILLIHECIHYNLKIYYKNEEITENQEIEDKNLNSTLNSSSNSVNSKDIINNKFTNNKFTNNKFTNNKFINNKFINNKFTNNKYIYTIQNKVQNKFKNFMSLFQDDEDIVKDINHS